MLPDVSPDFRWSRRDTGLIRKILVHAETPRAIREFSRHAGRLTNHAYWFVLSTLWVSYTGWSDLDEWKRLFASTRPLRDTSIMKPSELEIFRELPEMLTLYRAHRANEKDWISYTLLPVKAAEFAQRRAVDLVAEYRVAKADALCLFLRRGEFEVLVLDKGKAEFVRELPVVKG
jgi:hypothetical protein